MLYTSEEIFSLKGIKDPLPSITLGSECHWLQIFDPDGRKTEEIRRKKEQIKREHLAPKNKQKKKTTPVVPFRTVPDFFSSSTELETKFPCKGIFGGAGTFGSSAFDCPREDPLSSFKSEEDSFAEFATPPGSPIRTRTPAPIMSTEISRSSTEEEKENSLSMYSQHFVVKRISRSSDSEMPSTSEEKPSGRFSAPKKVIPNGKEELQAPGEPIVDQETINNWAKKVTGMDLQKTEGKLTAKIPKDPKTRPNPPKKEPVKLGKLQLSPPFSVMPIPLIWASPILPLLPPGLSLPPPPLPLMMMPPPGLCPLPPPGLPQPHPVSHPSKEDLLDKKKEDITKELKKKILEAGVKTESEKKSLERRRSSQADSSYATDDSGRLSPALKKEQQMDENASKSRHSSGRSSAGLPVVKMSFNPKAVPFVPTSVLRNDEEKLPEMASQLSIHYNVNAPEFKPSGSRNEQKPPATIFGAPPPYEDHQKYSRTSPTIRSSPPRHLELIDSDEEDDFVDRPAPFIRTANGGIRDNPAASRAPSRMSRVAPSERSAAPSSSWKPSEPIWPPDFDIKGNPQPRGYSVFDRRNFAGCAPDPTWTGSRGNSRSQTSSRGPESESRGPILPMKFMKRRV